MRSHTYMIHPCKRWFNRSHTYMIHPCKRWFNRSHTYMIHPCKRWFNRRHHKLFYTNLHFIKKIAISYYILSLYLDWMFIQIFNQIATQSNQLQMESGQGSHWIIKSRNIFHLCAARSCHISVNSVFRQTFMTTCQ